MPTSWVSQRLDELRNELLLNSGRFFPLTDAEFTSLEASILEHGIQVEVLLGQHLPLIDGRHRLLIAQQHQLEVPCRLLKGLTAEKEREIATGLNAARRQLTTAQEISLVHSELHRDPGRSDNLIASICGVSPTTVGSARAKIAQEQRRELEASTLETSFATAPRATVRVAVDPPTRTDARGGTQTRPVPIAPKPEPPREVDLGPVTCIHGHVHTLWRSANSLYRLEAHPE